MATEAQITARLKLVAAGAPPTHYVFIPGDFNVPEGMTVVYARFICNDCQRSTSAQDRDMADWELGEHGAEQDFCGRCVARRAA